MSANSTSEGASGFRRPHLPGYVVDFDDQAGEWVATSISDSDTVLRGRNQRALDEARRRLVDDLADELSGIIRAAPSHGYSPPPRET